MGLARVLGLGLGLVPQHEWGREARKWCEYMKRKLMKKWQAMQLNFWMSTVGRLSWRLHKDSGRLIHRLFDLMHLLIGP